MKEAKSMTEQIRQSSEARIKALEEEVNRLQEAIVTQANVNRQAPVAEPQAADGWDDFDDLNETKVEDKPDLSAKVVQLEEQLAQKTKENDRAMEAARLEI